MNIIAHRGYWKSIEEKNSQIAFERAFENGFGVETDFRDCMGNIMISHNPPDGSEMTAEDFLNIYSKFPQAGLLAINIKADGLASSLTSIFNIINRKNYFMFDMSIPDMLGYCDRNTPFFTRISEIELEPILLNQADGVWLDSFRDDWYGADLINSLLTINKRVAIVSPELHQREYLSLWNKLRTECNIHNEQLILCTDYPDRAREYFNV
jgi:hypothetical protein